MALNQDYAKNQVFIGEDKRLRYRIYQAGAVVNDDGTVTGTLEDVTGWAFTWKLRPSQVAETILLTKTSASGIAIEGTYDVVPAANTQYVVVTLDDLDTWDPDADPPVAFSPATYHYALKRTNAGAETVLVWGKLPLAKVTTRL
jgi:hypothetical protein